MFDRDWYIWVKIKAEEVNRIIKLDKKIYFQNYCIKTLLDLLNLWQQLWIFIKFEQNPINCKLLEFTRMLSHVLQARSEQILFILIFAETVAKIMVKSRMKFIFVFCSLKIMVNIGINRRFYRRNNSAKSCKSAV